MAKAQAHLNVSSHCCFHLMTLRLVTLFIHPLYSVKCFSASDPCPDEFAGYMRRRDSKGRGQVYKMPIKICNAFSVSEKICQGFGVVFFFSSFFVFDGCFCRTAVLVQPASGSSSQPWGLREIIYLLNGYDLTICSFISWACRWLVLFLTSLLSQSVYKDMELKECFYSLMLLLFSS